MADERRVRTDFSAAVLRPVPGYQAVVDYLRREMSLGRIQPGDRLPSERKLAEQLGVARETLRQALRILEGSGQIVVARGASGGPIVQEAVLDPNVIRQDVASRAEQILELTEFRAVVEAAACTLAADRCEDRDLAELERAQRELAAASSKAESRAADTRFHLAIAEAAGNTYLRESIEEARVRMFDPVDLVSFDFIKDSSHAAHERILEAIRSGDGAAAAEAMRAHLSTTREEFSRVLQS
ncbi:FadR/GntR family transcriptional regulator [Agromyces aerolatus]|uniref:FadR/GntR family transcriptional regulator n=1 Tax=Agromyces sp. LY-1074 TaxID=3074080 RepID=UPI00285A37CB|nr:MULTISPECIES: FCD domain-containing protein [unclassified Agromyces]MDR5700426.1 FCD domain-containing protein [Agromyces sp. LY-1074]MDR5706947.1 FCD domain-containing protein [Agromyces sp. LY-1358]